MSYDERGAFMKRRSIKYIGLVLLCVAGCMFMAACGQDKESAVRNDEGSVLSGETEAKDVEKSTDPADYEIGTRDHYLAVWAQEKGLSYVEAESQEHGWSVSSMIRFIPERRITSCS